MSTTNITSRPRMAAIYAPSTVSARHWHGEGDVRGYRPSSGWTARADSPHYGLRLGPSLGWIIETKE